MEPPLKKADAEALFTRLHSESMSVDSNTPRAIRDRLAKAMRRAATDLEDYPRKAGRLNGRAKWIEEGCPEVEEI